MASFYVNKNSKLKTGWRLVKEEYQNGTRTQTTVPKIAWPSLGFTDSMSIDQARARAKELNQLNAVKRLETAKIARVAERVERDRLHHSAFIPKDLNEAFLKWLEDNVTGNDAHMARMKFMWETAKKIAIKLMLTPEHYAGNKKQIYRYFSSNEYSLDYTKKVIRVLNLYGKYAGRLTGKFFEEIPFPKGHDRELINDAYLSSDTYHGPSEPLTPDLFNEIRDCFSEAQQNWLHCSMWLGLRPSELDMVIEDRARKLWRIEDGEVDVLWIYQPKLTSVPRPKRWKPIPLIYPEQKQALELVIKGMAEAPLTQKLKSAAGIQLGLYGGRKGFTDLMLGLGQKIEDIAQWMGHTSLDMTWSTYKDRAQVHFTKPKLG